MQSLIEQSQYWKGWQMMLIVKGKTSGRYLPKHDVDLPMFRHCCNGYIEVQEIADYLPIFIAHNIQIMIQDETYGK